MHREVPECHRTDIGLGHGFPGQPRTGKLFLQGFEAILGLFQQLVHPRLMPFLFWALTALVVLGNGLVDGANSEADQAQYPRPFQAASGCQRFFGPHVPVEVVENGRAIDQGPGIVGCKSGYAHQWINGLELRALFRIDGAQLSMFMLDAVEPECNCGATAESPCHRVLGANGMGGYSGFGGIETKGPIDITIRPLACTATIMHQLMGDVDMPDWVKGAMLSCILSDTYFSVC